MRSHSINILLRDVLLSAMIILASFVVIEKTSKFEESRTGNLMAEIQWPDGDVDMDLWVKSPDDMTVGYSRKNGKTVNLLRDDLGNSGDTLRLNYENSFSRGLPDGIWIVGIHGYRANSPTPVTVRVVVRNQSGAQTWTHTRDIEVNPRQEVTAMRLHIEGGVVRNFDTIQERIAPFD